MEALYRGACGCLAFALVMLFTADPGRALSQRRALRLRTQLARQLRVVGASRLGRLACRSRSMRVLAERWGRAAGDRLGLFLGEAGGSGLVLSLVVAAGVLGGLVALSPIGVVAGALVAAVAVTLRAEALRRGRERDVAREMPGAFRSLASSLAAGRTLAQAMANLGEQGTGLVSEAFSRAALRLSCGYSAQEALERLSDELDAPGTTLITCALSVSHRTGSPLMGLFERSAELLERQGELERTLAVKTAQVRLSVRVVCLLPWILVALLTLISPDYRTGLATTAGTASVAVAVVLDAVAVLVIRHLMRGVL